MIKYWNPRRIRRVRDRERQEEANERERRKRQVELSRTYSTGDMHKNVRLMLDALGLPLRRKMLSRLAIGGAMSLSKLVEPFNIFLPSAQVQLRILVRAGLVETRKQGRVRICFLRPGAFREFSQLIGSAEVLKRLD